MHISNSHFSLNIHNHQPLDSTQNQPTNANRTSPGQTENKEAPGADNQPRLTRSVSSEAILQMAKFNSSRDHVLTELFGSSQPARGKIHNNVQSNPIQPDEREILPNGDWKTRINPTRVMVSGDKIMAADSTPLPGNLRQNLPLERLKNKEITVKWDISRNGTLSIGVTKIPSTVPSSKGNYFHKLGHPTLVGGLKIPEARISGMLYFNEQGELAINNDSGRFSEYADKKPEHLNAVAELFKQHDLPVKTEWMQKVTIPVVR